MTDNMRYLVSTAGKPWSQSIRIVGAKTYWNSVDELEVRSQLRAGRDTSAALIANLHEYMTWAFDTVTPEDLIITWQMSGEATRKFYAEAAWGKTRKGYFTVNITDVGTVDAHAIITPLIAFKMIDSTTTAEGS